MMIDSLENAKAVLIKSPHIIKVMKKMLEKDLINSDIALTIATCCYYTLKLNLVNSVEDIHSLCFINKAL